MFQNVYKITRCKLLETNQQASLPRGVPTMEVLSIPPLVSFYLRDGKVKSVTANIGILQGLAMDFPLVDLKLYFLCSPKLTVVSF